jgi:hypothetical protein
LRENPGPKNVNIPAAFRNPKAANFSDIKLTIGIMYTNLAIVNDALRLT